MAADNRRLDRADRLTSIRMLVHVDSGTVIAIPDAYLSETPPGLSRHP